MKLSVFVYGPPGCGKSRNARRIMRYLDLGDLLDNWATGEPFPEENTLILSNNPPWNTDRKFKSYRFDYIVGKIRGVM